jgi:hypothetical protein
MSGPTEVLRTATIQLRSPHEWGAQRCWDILEGVNARYPHLCKSSSAVDDHEARYRLVSEDGPGHERAVFVIEHDNVFIASREELSPRQWDTRVLDCTAAVVRHAAIQPLSIEQVGTEILPTWRTTVHHARTLFHAFGRGGALAEMLGGLHIMQFAPYALCLIDRDDLIVCSLRIKSIGPWEADLDDAYREPLDMVLEAAVSKIGAFHKHDTVHTMMERVLGHAGGFFEGPFRRHGIDVISALL